VVVAEMPGEVLSVTGKEIVLRETHWRAAHSTNCANTSARTNPRVSISVRPLSKVRL